MTSEQRESSSERAYSLSTRLITTSLLLLMVFTLLITFALNKAFEDSVIRNAKNALRSQILVLISNLELENGRVLLPQVMASSRLSQPDSGLYAQINDGDGNVLWQSESALERTLPELASTQGEFRFYEDQLWFDQRYLHAMSVQIVWEEDNASFPFTVTMAESVLPYQQRLNQYRTQVVLWLVGLAIAVLLMQWLLMRWLLAPLSTVMRQARDIEAGQRQRFDGDFPREVRQLTVGLNQLLDYEEKQISQQKNVLGNLAHSLKTPIAVLKGLRFSDQVKGEADKQIGLMQDIVDYQLSKASAVGRRHFAKPILIKNDTEQLINTLKKLYADKSVEVILDIDESVQFFGDKGDWMEVMGNLLDNAWKWCHAKIEISVRNVEAISDNTNFDNTRKSVAVVISDDGPGISDERKQEITKRGVRLDTQTPGHGLGLHIVSSIVDSYNGSVRIEDVAPSGTRFVLQLN